MEEALREYAESIYATVADILWQNSAADALVARIASALSRTGGHYFQATDFRERAYGLNTSHP